MAVLPLHLGGWFLPWDQAQQFLAFYTLTVLALLDFPRADAPLPAIAAVLLPMQLARRRRRQAGPGRGAPFRAGSAAA
jgi:hypothetical protein